jgi:hypothetical protein
MKAILSWKWAAVFALAGAQMISAQNLNPQEASGLALFPSVHP